MASAVSAFFVSNLSVARSCQPCMAETQEIATVTRLPQGMRKNTCFRLETLALTLNSKKRANGHQVKHLDEGLG